MSSRSVITDSPMFSSLRPRLLITLMLTRTNLMLKLNDLPTLRPFTLATTVMKSTRGLPRLGIRVPQYLYQYSTKVLAVALPLYTFKNL